jgi:hypothetical protein
VRLHALLGFRRGGPLSGFMSASSLLPLLDRFEVVSFRAARTIQAPPALVVRPPARGNRATVPTSLNGPIAGAVTRGVTA